MKTDREAFLNAIEATPLDEAQRGAYADWLDEHDEPEEATRQRQWVRAYHFLKTFTREADEGYDYDGDGERIPGTLKSNHGNVMAEIEYWAECAARGREDEYGDTICFSTTHAQDALQDQETKREFWRCLQVVTGVDAPTELRNQEWYRCSC